MTFCFFFMSMSGDDNRYRKTQSHRKIDEKVNSKIRTFNDSFIQEYITVKTAGSDLKSCRNHRVRRRFYLKINSTKRSSTISGCDFRLKKCDLFQILLILKCFEFVDNKVSRDSIKLGSIPFRDFYNLCTSSWSSLQVAKAVRDQGQNDHTCFRFPVRQDTPDKAAPRSTPRLKARVKRQATSSYLGSVAAGGYDITSKKYIDDIDNIEEGEGDRILLNVGGVRHETHVSTLKTIPRSRLSRLAEVHLDNGKGKQEYFFDRHPSVFNSIIDFYRTGELHVPLEVCGAVVKRELDFWQINELEIKACCWRHYRSYIENQNILDSFNHSLRSQAVDVDLNSLNGWKKMQWTVWLILEYPRTSRAAMIYGVTSFLFVVTSIAGFCLETLPDLGPKFVHNATACDGENPVQMGQMITANEALTIVDIICTVFFSLELILRFMFAPDKIRFVRSLMNIIDLLALVPLYVQVIFTNSDQMKNCYLNERFVIEIMFILRIIRMFRIFHLVKHYQALKVLVYAIKASIQELLMLFIFLLIGMLIFSTMIYYAERKNTTEGGDMFSTIPMGFWWSIITMTTVGYGDVYPKTPIGYIVGTACAVCGVLLVALTIPVISNNFTLFYRHVQSRTAIPRCKGGDASEYGSALELENTNSSKSSLGSNVLTYMNGHVTGPGLYRNKINKPVDSAARWSKFDSTTSVSLKKSASDFNFSHSRSFKAYSDDGVMYKGETDV